MDRRPIVRALVGYELPGGECRAMNAVFTLEEAAVLASYGWSVVIDPFDREELTRWEQLERSVQQRSSWNRLILGGTD